MNREERREAVILSRHCSSVHTSSERTLWVHYLSNLLEVEEAGIVEWCVSMFVGSIGVDSLVLQQLT